MPSAARLRVSTISCPWWVRNLAAASIDLSLNSLTVDLQDSRRFAPLSFRLVVRGACGTRRGRKGGAKEVVEEFFSLRCFLQSFSSWKLLLRGKFSGNIACPCALRGPCASMRMQGRRRRDIAVSYKSFDGRYQTSIYKNRLYIHRARKCE